MHASVSTPAWNRLLHIINALNAHRNLTSVKLAEEMGVTERTIKRYIAYMRNNLEMEIIWEPTSRSYYCERPYEYIPLLRVTGEEALSLALASKTFAAWQGTALGKALDSVLSKVGQVVGGAISVPVSEIQSFLSTPQVGHENDREHTWFGTLLEAIRLKRELKVRYKKPDAKRSETRVLWPLHLAYLDHHWALISWDQKKDEPRKFLLDRMESVERTGGRFEAPADFDVPQYLRDSFGLFTGDEVFEVFVRFDETASPYIRERLWHSSQEIDEQPDGSLIAHFRVNHLMDIKRWILSWGSHARVIRPEQLRNDLTEEVRQLVEHYGGFSLIIDEPKTPFIQHAK